jgi:hypothetical protein
MNEEHFVRTSAPRLISDVAVHDLSKTEMPSTTKAIQNLRI